MHIQRLRGDLVESTHRISAAVVRPDGTLVASSGDPGLVTFWRSGAKPFQAVPLVADGVLEAFGMGTEELALACASHSSEPEHLALADRMLARIGCTEDDLACGPHTPLDSEVARQVTRLGTTLTPRWSNCSGKHAGMLALARHHGWPTAGYERQGHPVQERIMAEVLRWTGMEPSQLHMAVDGCTTVCFGLPVHNMALAYARLAGSDDSALSAVRDAMLAHPHLIAGERRFCTELMRALPGRIIAKVGAEGVYCAALPAGGLGIGLKVEDGNMPVAPGAMYEVCRQVLARFRPGDPWPDGALSRWASHRERNTRGAEVGTTRVTGELRFLADA